MADVALLIRRGLSLPLPVALRRARELAALRAGREWQRIRVRRGFDPSAEHHVAARLAGGAARPQAVAPRLFRCDGAVLPASPELDPPDGDTARAVRWLAEETLAHRFDLLGSGPVQVGYTLEAAGVEGHRYAMAPGPEAAARTRRRMDALLPGSATGYDPIDWHVDFRSGFRWAPDEPFFAITYGDRPGVDVKVPWELSRFLHAGTLGLAARWWPVEALGEDAARELVRQIVDWIAANPYGRGVNWVCPMDVALRAVNWLIGIGLLAEHPALTDEFRWLVARSLYAHGHYLERNLEYLREQSGNHYLCNVLGMLTIGAAIPQLDCADRWLCWAIQELVSEMRRQVQPDGMSIEGSTAYHCLVTEAFLLGTAIVQRLPQARRERLARVPRGRLAHPTAPPFRSLADAGCDPDRPEIFPDWYRGRLRRMLEFAVDVLKPDGRIPQVGDHDSGRVYRLRPPVAAAPPAQFREDPNDRRTIFAVAGRLFGDEALAEIGRGYVPDADALVGRAGAADAWRSRAESGHAVRRSDPVLGTLTRYPSGILVARCGPLFLLVSAARLADGYGGSHLHNDLLSVELQWSGWDVIVDGGSYLYTPAPALRNAFRSTAAHSTLVLKGLEQRAWPPGRAGLFLIERDADTEIGEAGPGIIRAACRYAGAAHERVFRWDRQRLTIADRFDGPGPADLVFNLAPGLNVASAPAPDGDEWVIPLEQGERAASIRMRGVAAVRCIDGCYSEGYGRRIPNRRLVARLTGTSSVAEISFGAEAASARSGKAARP